MSIPCVDNMTEFARMFTNILNTDEEYCRLCLRTSSEITLVQPKYTNHLLDAIELVNLDLSDSRVCEWCEARAQAAHRVVLMLFYARDVTTLLATANDSKVYRQQLELFLEGKSLPSGSTAALRRLATRAAARVDNSRLRLCRTETLVIDTTTQGQSETKKKNTVEGANLGEIVISDDDSDNECIYMPMIHPKPIEQLLDRSRAENKTSPDAILSDLPAKTLDNFMGKLPVTNMNIPAADVNIATPEVNFTTGRFENGFSATLTPIVLPNLPIIPNVGQDGTNRQPPSEFLYVVEKSGMTLHPVYKNDRGQYSAPTLVEEPNKLPIITQTVSLDSKPLKRVTEKEVLEVLKSRMDKAVKRGLGVSPNSTKKKAVENTTDWEDKIPMDVISFMNEKQPKKMSATICAIADVRSIKS